MTLTKQEKSISIIYILLIVFEQLTSINQDFQQLHYLAKPLLVLSLLIFFWKNSKMVPSISRYLMVLALLFSVTGDIFLMFTSYEGAFFIAGLLSFLIAHVMYILSFNKEKGNGKFLTPFSVVILLFALGLFYTLYPNLDSLVIPVLLYTLVISTMAIYAYLRKGAVGYFSFTLVLLGALFFMVSDSLIAINKFYSPIAYPKSSIMITYAIAQYCIVIGYLKKS